MRGPPESAVRGSEREEPIWRVTLEQRMRTERRCQTCSPLKPQRSLPGGNITKTKCVPIAVTRAVLSFGGPRKKYSAESCTTTPPPASVGGLARALVKLSEKPRSDYGPGLLANIEVTCVCVTDARPATPPPEMIWLHRVQVSLRGFTHYERVASKLPEAPRPLNRYFYGY
ncbi:hypothetical protein J6590_061083 [Homalodisca vitripennis]|nr:hypothetical protein J6590_061083 [Homalodisca vitripennis]